MEATSKRGLPGGNRDVLGHRAEAGAKQSVTGRSLVHVLGTPTQVTWKPIWSPIWDTLCAVSMESLPPL